MVGSRITQALNPLAFEQSFAFLTLGGKFSTSTSLTNTLQLLGPITAFPPLPLNYITMKVKN